MLHFAKTFIGKYIKFMQRVNISDEERNQAARIYLPHELNWITENCHRSGFLDLDPYLLLKMRISQPCCISLNNFFQSYSLHRRRLVALEVECRCGLRLQTQNSDHPRIRLSHCGWTLFGVSITLCTPLSV